jgi:Ca2+-binding EF-hand superfamily protein
MKAIIATALISALALPAFAADDAKDGDKKPAKKRPTPEAVFKKKDTNADGFLSKDEFVAKMKDAEKAAKAFTRKDKDGDGKLSLDEFKPKLKKKKDAPAGDQKKKKGKKDKPADKDK